VIKNVMPPILVGLILAALLSAVMSSAVTCLLSVSTILTTDVIHKFKPAITENKLLMISKWGIVILGLVALSVALLLKGIINSLMFAYTIYTAGLIPIVIAGFTKKSSRLLPSVRWSRLLSAERPVLLSRFTPVVKRR